MQRAVETQQRGGASTPQRTRITSRIGGVGSSLWIQSRKPARAAPLCGIAWRLDGPSSKRLRGYYYRLRACGPWLCAPEVAPWPCSACARHCGTSANAHGAYTSAVHHHSIPQHRIPRSTVSSTASHATDTARHPSRRTRAVVREPLSEHRDDLRLVPHLLAPERLRAPQTSQAPIAVHVQTHRPNRCRVASKAAATACARKAAREMCAGPEPMAAAAHATVVRVGTADVAARTDAQALSRHQVKIKRTLSVRNDAGAMPSEARAVCIRQTRTDTAQPSKEAFML
jgi:hypothetical protein